MFYMLLSHNLSLVLGHNCYVLILCHVHVFKLCRYSSKLLRLPDCYGLGQAITGVA